MLLQLVVQSPEPRVGVDLMAVGLHRTSFESYRTSLR